MQLVNMVRGERILLRTPQGDVEIRLLDTYPVSKTKVARLGLTANRSIVIMREELLAKEKQS